MQAKTGDRILIHGQRIGEPDRKGIILDVRGDDGSPPYVVEWSDREGEHLFFPGPDAMIRPGPRRR